MNTKTIEEKKEEYARNEMRIQQYRHQMDRAENRIKYLNKKERSARTHQLCNLGGVVEHFIPKAGTMDRTVFYQLMEQIISIPEVDALIQNFGGETLSRSSTSM